MCYSCLHLRCQDSCTHPGVLVPLQANNLEFLIIPTSSLGVLVYRRVVEFPFASQSSNTLCHHSLDKCSQVKNLLWFLFSCKTLLFAPLHVNAALLCTSAQEHLSSQSIAIPDPVYHAVQSSPMPRNASYPLYWAPQLSSSRAALCSYIVSISYHENLWSCSFCQLFLQGREHSSLGTLLHAWSIECDIHMYCLPWTHALLLYKSKLNSYSESLAFALQRLELSRRVSGWKCPCCVLAQQCFLMRQNQKDSKGDASSQTMWFHLLK